MSVASSSRIAQVVFRRREVFFSMAANDSSAGVSSERTVSDAPIPSLLTSLSSAHQFVSIDLPGSFLYIHSLINFLVIVAYAPLMTMLLRKADVYSLL
nr:hypothetical protein Iba_chr11dCG12510 [Ipomoea batatas]